MLHDKVFNVVSYDIHKCHIIYTMCYPHYTQMPALAGMTKNFHLGKLFKKSCTMYKYELQLWDVESNEKYRFYGALWNYL